jgi:orotidine-5'-phosphate decarboxylase
MGDNKMNVSGKPAKDYLVFPLDVASVAEARRYVELLAEDVGMFKVGLELFIRSGPEIIKFIQSAGTAGVFLDLKLHDIPETVSRAMQSIADMGVAYTTVHCGETRRMLEAAVSGSRGRVGVLAVTVLTSVTGEDIQAAGFRSDLHSDIAKLALQRAEMAKTAGCAGVVCSGLEAAVMKARFGRDFVVVTPGIRPLAAGAVQDDQQRITTPGQAIQNGSDYLVIGRPIRDAADPRSAAGRIAAEIAAALQDRNQNR